MTKFKFLEERERKQQFFDKDKIVITKAGKTYNVYQSIQEAREDTEIYPTLEKYGCIENLPQIKTQDMFDDFTELQKMRSPFEAEKQVKDMWSNLPLDIRKEFNHSINDFAKYGKMWIENKIADEKAKKEKLEKTIKLEQELMKGKTNNE